MGTETLADGTVLKEGIWKDGIFQYSQAVSPPASGSQDPKSNNDLVSASSGSGFAISSDGYVITNNHVIDGCQQVVVHTKSDEIKVRIVTFDPQNDLALLKGDFRPTTVLPLSTTRPELLQDIYVAGFPFGNELSSSIKVTKGIISSLTGIGNNFSNIQIDAALQIGNSGGPIVDDMGNVIAVAVSKLDAKYMFENFGVIPENTNFGIKASVVRSLLDSNGVDAAPARASEISRSDLGKMISDSTYYISCWMTVAQVKDMKMKKVMFSNLE
jgi:S1-C subfamily serine protease